MKGKKDRFRKARGGNSTLLDIHCAACDTFVLRYQKDGPGGLVRMYLDRILAPLDLADLQNMCEFKEDVPNLTCSHCQAVIGTPMVHEKEKRLAFRVIPGRLRKKKPRLQ